MTHESKESSDVVRAAMDDYVNWIARDGRRANQLRAFVLLAQAHPSQLSIHELLEAGLCQRRERRRSGAGARTDRKAARSVLSSLRRTLYKATATEMPRSGYSITLASSRTGGPDELYGLDATTHAIPIHTANTPLWRAIRELLRPVVPVIRSDHPPTSSTLHQLVDRLRRASSEIVRLLRFHERGT